MISYTNTKITSSYRVRSQGGGYFWRRGGDGGRGCRGAGEGFWDVSSILILDQDGDHIGFAL